MAELKGSDLLSLRDSLRIQQMPFAARLGVYRQTVGDVEADRINVDPATFRVWFRTLWQMHEEREARARAQSEHMMTAA